MGFQKVTKEKEYFLFIDLLKYFIFFWK